MTFRQDINGLRAWAVIAVMLFHFDIPGLQGGFAGVDVFFVISGYLMTEIIFRRFEKKSFSFIGFYLDRSRRIIPALAILCIVMLMIGWCNFAAYEYLQLGKQVWGSAGFFSNFLYLDEAGYFEKNSLSGKWLQHTWSLSLEWQFYLLYPLLILMFAKLAGWQRAKYGIAICAIVSLVHCINLSAHSSETAFYLLSTRIWELLAGGAVCLFPVQLSARSKVWMECCGFTLILYTFNQMTGVAWPGWHAMVPVAGAALILMAARQQSIFTSNRIAQRLGTASYSIYLWHWPIAYALYKSGLLKAYSFSIAGMVLAIVLGVLSWRYIEKPFQKQKQNVRMSKGYALLIIAAFSLVISIAGYLVYVKEGIPKRSWGEQQRLKNEFLEKYESMYKNLDEYYHFECGFFDEKKYVRRESIAPSCTNNLHKKIIFLWGDSHAQAISTGLRTLVKENFSVAQVATSQCKPGLSGPQAWDVPTVDTNCRYANQFALQEIARLKPSYVIMAQQNNHERSDWNLIADKLHQLGVQHVVLLGPVPQWDLPLPMIMVERHWQNNEFSIEDNAQVEDVFKTDKILNHSYGASKNIIYVSMIHVLCENKKCQVKVPGDGELMMFDYGHLTPKGSIYAVQVALGNVIVDR